jgi:hypothetical protein
LNSQSSIDQLWSPVLIRVGEGEEHLWPIFWGTGF